MFKNLLRGSDKGEQKNKDRKKVKTKRKPIASGSGKVVYTMDFGSKTSKLVVGRFRGSRISISSMAGTVNEKGSVFDAKILNIPDTQRTFRKLAKASRVNLNDVVYTVETTGLIRRDIDIPNVPDTDVLGTVTYQMSDYLPIDINSYVLQVKQIGTFQEDGNTRRKFSVAALPKDITDSYQNFSEAMNITSSKMDIHSNAIEKLLELEIKVNSRSEFKNKNVVFIDMGHSFFNVSIYSDGKYLYNRMIPIGSKMIDGVIAARLKKSEEEAEKIKLQNSSKYSVLDLVHRFSKNDPTRNIETEVLRDTLKVYENWVSEINSVLNYFTTRDRDNHINEIYLYGGCSFINGMDEYVERRLRLPTHTFANFRCIEFDNSNEVDENILNYLNTIGALIRS